MFFRGISIQHCALLLQLCFILVLVLVFFSFFFFSVRPQKDFSASVLLLSALRPKSSDFGSAHFSDCGCLPIVILINSAKGALQGSRGGGLDRLWFVN